MIDEIDELLDEGTDLDFEGNEESSLYEHFRVVADKGQELVRVDKFLIDHLPHASRNRIQKSAEAGCLHVNGKPVKQEPKKKSLTEKQEVENRVRPQQYR